MEYKYVVQVKAQWGGDKWLTSRDIDNDGNRSGIASYATFSEATAAFARLIIWDEWDKQYRVIECHPLQDIIKVWVATCKDAFDE